MGVPTSEVGYTSAMPRREDHEVPNYMWGIGIYIYIYIYIYIFITQNTTRMPHLKKEEFHNLNSLETK